MELSAEAKKEFQDAIRILREDGLHIHKTYARFQAAQNQQAPEPEVKPEPKEGDPPPVKEKTEEDVKPPRDWWFGARGN